MKNKGFTLIELLAVILIIGIIATITTPIITGVISTSREKACERQEEMILDAARRWGSDNAINLDLEEVDGITGVKIKTLTDAGYLNTKELKNPKTNTDIDEDTFIEIEYTSNQYSYSINLCE